MDTGEGYSPRLRMMSGDRFTQGDTAATTATSSVVPGSAAAAELASPVLSVEPSHSAAAFAGFNDATCGDEGQCVIYDAATMTSSFPRRDKDEARERDPPGDASADSMTSGAIWGNPARAKASGPSQTRERARAISRDGCLCGRLWTGTTASPRTDAVRPRILFLVSGRQQSPRKEEEATRAKRGGESRHRERSRRREAPLVVSLPPPVNARTCEQRGKRTRSGGWRRGCVGSNVARRVEGKGACGGGETSPRYPAGSDGEESCDAETTAATDGKGSDSARRVVHVRVPPTPLLIFGSVLPTAEQG